MDRIPSWASEAAQFILIVGAAILFGVFVLPPLDATFGAWWILVPIVVIAFIARYGWPRHPRASRTVFYVLVIVVVYVFWRYMAPVLESTFGYWWLPSLIVALFIVGSQEIG
jgi:hypothetical protein